MRKADKERYDCYLRKLRKLSWNAYVTTMAAERDKPEAERHPAWDDAMFHKACAAFERNMCPSGGGRGRIPNALRD